MRVRSRHQAFGGRLGLVTPVCSMDVPRELSLLLADREFEAVELGDSGAGVWRCPLPGQAPRYLKVAPVDAQLALEQEAARLRWMRDRGLPVPAVLAYLRQGDAEYLLTEAAVGVPASASEWREAAERVATALGRGLARLHATDVATCPFDRRVDRQLKEARARLARGMVREDDFDACRRGRDAAELFTELLGMVPGEENLVLVHGDFCLPNVLLTQTEGGLHVTGLVDCGRAGIGDRHQDLALAVRSLTANLGHETVAPFLSAYDGPPVNAQSLAFFTVLDEFF